MRNGLNCFFNDRSLKSFLDKFVVFTLALINWHWLLLFFYSCTYGLSFKINLSKKVLVKPFHHLFLSLANIVLTRIYPYGVRLAARIYEIVLVIVSAAPAPSAVHQLLVVDDAHSGWCDAPVGVPGRHSLLLTLAIAAVVTPIGVRMAFVEIDEGLPLSDDWWHLIYYNIINMKSATKDLISKIDEEESYMDSCKSKGFPSNQEESSREQRRSSTNRKQVRVTVTLEESARN